MKKVICYGSATRDIFINMKETRVIENKEDLTAQKLMAFEFGAKEYAQSFNESIGGGAVNMAASLAKMDIKPFVFSRVSKGEDGKWILKRMSRMGIKKNYTQQTGGENSEISVIISDKKNRDHVILRTGDSVIKFNLEKATEKFREKVDWLLVSSQREGWQDDFEKIVDFAKEKNARIALNPSSFQVGGDTESLVKFMKNLDIIFVNRDEALEIIKRTERFRSLLREGFGGQAGDTEPATEIEDDIEKLLEVLKEFGVKIAVITDGERGAYAKDEEGSYKLKADIIEKGDTVGAGDAFAGAFLAGYIDTGDTKKALGWGIANSAGVVSRLGATNGILSKKELKKKEKELRDKIEEI